MSFTNFELGRDGEEGRSLLLLLRLPSLLLLRSPSPLPLLLHHYCCCICHCCCVRHRCCVRHCCCCVHHRDVGAEFAIVPLLLSLPSLPRCCLPLLPLLRFAIVVAAATVACHRSLAGASHCCHWQCLPLLPADHFCVVASCSLRAHHCQPLLPKLIACLLACLPSLPALCLPFSVPCCSVSLLQPSVVCIVSSLCCIGGCRRWLPKVLLHAGH